MGRRELFAVSAGGLLLGTANTVLACTPYIGPKPVPINLSKCREKIATLIEFANISDQKTDEEYLAWVERTGISPDYEGDDFENADPVRSMRNSYGKPDSKPIKLLETSLLKNVSNRASFVFVLERHSWSPAQDCDGEEWESEGFSTRAKAYVAQFHNNVFTSFRDFTEWFV